MKKFRIEWSITGGEKRFLFKNKESEAKGLVNKVVEDAKELGAYFDVYPTIVVVEPTEPKIVKKKAKKKATKKA